MKKELKEIIFEKMGDFNTHIRQPSGNR
jgi:hypothetical protein